MSTPEPIRQGRPRAVAQAATASTPREEILDAAAALFAERGYVATSTRAIAERVGIRQASLYYHFAGKDELLLELLETSVRPSLEFLAVIDSAEDPVATLYALAAVDVGTLLATPHNIGVLYRLPEVQDERFADFRDHRARLQSAYVALAARIAGGDGTFLGACCMQLVEMVIDLRREGDVGPEAADSIALACLRVVGAHSGAATGAALLQRLLGVPAT